MGFPTLMMTRWHYCRCRVRMEKSHQSLWRGQWGKLNPDMFSLEMFEKSRLSWQNIRMHRFRIHRKNGYNTFSICQVIPQLVELWGLNVKMDVEAKKTLIDRLWNDNTIIPVKVRTVRFVDGRLGIAVDRSYQWYVCRKYKWWLPICPDCHTGEFW